MPSEITETMIEAATAVFEEEFNGTYSGRELVEKTLHAALDARPASEAGSAPLPRRSENASPEILTPYGWMSLPHEGPYDDASLLQLAEERHRKGDDCFKRKGNNLTTALAARPAGSVMHPVAWRVRERPGFAWHLLDYDPDRIPSLQGHEKQPLYSAAVIAEREEQTECERELLKAEGDEYFRLKEKWKARAERLKRAIQTVLDGKEVPDPADDNRSTIMVDWNGEEREAILRAALQQECESDE